MSENQTANSSAGSGGGSGGSGSGGGGPCGACKFLRRKCVQGCIFAPYFDSEQGAAHFAAVHKVFGASNVSKLLLHLPVNRRLDAVITICYEAQARLRDPIYGCVANIFSLQQQVANLQTELSYLQAQLATLDFPLLPPPPPPPPPPSQLTPMPVSIPNIPSSSSVPASYNSSTLFDPDVQPAWTFQNQLVEPGPFESGGGSATGSGGGDDLQAWARELFDRHVGSTLDSTSPSVSK